MDTKKLFENVQKSTKSKITEQDVKNLAGNIKPSDVTNEQSLRQLIYQISALADVPVNEQTIQQIIHAIKQSGTDPNNMEQLLKLMQAK
jgi:hypothetical protein